MMLLLRLVLLLLLILRILLILLLQLLLQLLLLLLLMSEVVCRLAIALPKPKLLFTQNIDPQASSNSPARPLEESDGESREW